MVAQRFLKISLFFTFLVFSGTSYCNTSQDSYGVVNQVRETSEECTHAKERLKEFVRDLMKLANQSKEYASDAPTIKKFRTLRLCAGIIEKELKIAHTTDELLESTQNVIDLLERENYTPPEEHTDVSRETLEQAYEKLLDVFDFFLAKHHDIITPRITEIGAIQRTFLKTLSMVWYHVSYAHLTHRFKQQPGEPEADTPSPEKKTFVDELKKRAPFFALTTGKIGIDWAINEIRPSAGASTQQRWVELLTSYIAGFLIARAIVGNSDGFKSSTFNAVGLDVFNNLTRAKFYLSKSSHLFKFANTWSYLWIFSVFLNPDYLPKLFEDDYETLTTVLATVGKDVLSCLKELIGESIPGVLESSVNWPALLQKKPRRRAITYFIAIAINNILSAAGKVARDA